MCACQPEKSRWIGFSTLTGNFLVSLNCNFTLTPKALSRLRSRSIRRDPRRPDNTSHNGKRCFLPLYSCPAFYGVLEFEFCLYPPAFSSSSCDYNHLRFPSVSFLSLGSHAYQNAMSQSTGKVKAGQLWSKNKEDLHKQLSELKTELGQLRIQKIASSGTKLNKMYVYNREESIAITGRGLRENPG